MLEVETKTEQNEGTQTQQQTQQQSTETQTHQKENNIDVSKLKEEAISEYLKSLGVDSDEALKGIVTKHKDDEEKNKTELQKSNDTLTATTKQLAEEREARLISEAKLSAIQLGAKPELVEDLVIVAKSKVTKDKDINAVIAEIKDSNSGKVYFKNEEEEDEKNKKGGTVTRGKVTKQNETKTKQDGEQEEDKYKGTMAERILSSKKRVKSHYFK